MSQDDAECIARWLSAAESGHLDAGAECIVAEVRRLRAENERLRAALKPFADEARSEYAVKHGADGWDGAPHDCHLHLFSRCWNGDHGPTVGDCVRAAELLAATEPPKTIPGEG